MSSPHEKGDSLLQAQDSVESLQHRFPYLRKLPPLSDMQIATQSTESTEHPYILLLGTIHESPLWIGLGKAQSRHTFAPVLFISRQERDGTLESLGSKALSEVDMREPFRSLWLAMETLPNSGHTGDLKRGRIKSLACWYLLNDAERRGSEFRWHSALTGYLHAALDILEKGRVGTKGNLSKREGVTSTQKRITAIHQQDEIETLIEESSRKKKVEQFMMQREAELHHEGNSDSERQGQDTEMVKPWERIEIRKEMAHSNESPVLKTEDEWVAPERGAPSSLPYHTEDNNEPLQPLTPNSEEPYSGYNDNSERGRKLDESHCCFQQALNRYPSSSSKLPIMQTKQFIPHGGIRNLPILNHIKPLESLLDSTASHISGSVTGNRHTPPLSCANHCTVSPVNRTNRLAEQMVSKTPVAYSLRLLQHNAARHAEPIGVDSVEEFQVLVDEFTSLKRKADEAERGLEKIKRNKDEARMRLIGCLMKM